MYCKTADLIFLCLYNNEFINIQVTIYLETFDTQIKLLQFLSTS